MLMITAETHGTCRAESPRGSKTVARAIQVHSAASQAPQTPQIFNQLVVSLRRIGLTTIRLCKNYPPATSRSYNPAWAEAIIPASYRVRTSS